MVDGQLPQRAAMTRGNARANETHDRLRAEFRSCTEGFVGFTQTYGSSILVERLAWNGMTWRNRMAACAGMTGV